MALAGIAGISASANAGQPGILFAYVAESGSGDVLPFDASRLTPLGYPGRPIPVISTDGVLDAVSLSGGRTLTVRTVTKADVEDWTRCSRD